MHFATLNSRATKSTLRPRIVVIKTPTGFVPEVDPVTRKATARPKQFHLLSDGQLLMRDPADAVEQPEEYLVDFVDYR